MASEASRWPSIAPRKPTGPQGPARGSADPVPPLPASTPRKLSIAGWDVVMRGCASVVWKTATEVGGQRPCPPHGEAAPVPCAGGHASSAGGRRSVGGRQGGWRTARVAALQTK